MTTYYEYPPTLPNPTLATTTAIDRRLQHQLTGPYSYRRSQTSRHSLQKLEFVFTSVEAAVFEDWVENTLIKGGTWFRSNWPHPAGGVARRRFITRPSYPEYQLFEGGGWKVQALCEVMGPGLDPVVNGTRTYCFHETYASKGGWNQITTPDPDPDFWKLGGSIYGRTFIFAAGSHAGLVLEKSLAHIDPNTGTLVGSTFTYAVSWKMRCRAGTERPGSSTYISIGSFNVIPKEASSLDPFRIPKVVVNGESQNIMFTPLLDDIWYDFKIVFVAGAGNTVIKAWKSTDDPTIAGNFTDTTFANSHMPVNRTTFKLIKQDGFPNQTSGVEFADLTICEGEV